MKFLKAFIFGFFFSVGVPNIVCAGQTELGTSFRGVDTSKCAQGNMDCVAFYKNVESATLMHGEEAVGLDSSRLKLEHQRRVSDHYVSALWAQYYQTLIIMIMVLAIVGAGIAMSWKHMMYGFISGKNEVNSFEVGKDGVKLGSPVIGLFIFLGSIYFFSVYVDKVYTISVINGVTDSNTSSVKTHIKSAESPSN